MSKKADVVIIGAGIVGVFLAYYLSGYDLDVLVLEQESDVSMGTTRANSAILHAGYDPAPGTKMAQSNVKGSRIWKEIANKHDIPYKEVGSLVVAQDEEEMTVVRALYERGLANGVERMRLLTGEETRRIEPGLRQTICGALLAETAAIIDPWQSCVALMEHAAANGVGFRFSSPVTKIIQNEGGFTIPCGDELISAAFVVNAAGIHADEVHALVGGSGFSNHAVQGEYVLLDKAAAQSVKHVVFPVPSRAGKGVLVLPTVHGNLLVGPTSRPIDDKVSVSTSADGQRQIREMALRLFPELSFSLPIRTYSGNRAAIEEDDFLLEESAVCARFFNFAGIKSPGLTSAPALALEMLELLESAGLTLRKKEESPPFRYPKRLIERTASEQDVLIKSDARYGRVICRCETVTEGDIVRWLRSPLTPPTVSAIKRRCNAGLGRCQGGFCSVRVQEIIARERGMSPEAVTMDGNGSYIVVGDTKRGFDES